MFPVRGLRPKLMSRSFLDESRNTDFIRWSDSGDSFIVLDEDEFARRLIPEMFKHNNYASFVRQLNMYGFHKRVGLSDNSMRASERKNKTPSEYSNPYFKRGRPLLLWLIQKPKSTNSKVKSGRGKAEENIDDDGEDFYDADNTHGAEQNNDDCLRDQQHPLLIGQGQDGRSLKEGELDAVNSQLRQIRQQQQMITSMLGKIRREHEDLYSQAAAFTDLHSRHENSINAILTFLATIYNRSLEGQGSQNMANLFAGAIPPDMSQPGNIMDFGQSDGATDGIARRSSRRHPLLLQAPPTNQRRGSAGGPYSSSQANNSSNAHFAGSNAATPRPGVVEEIYDADTPQGNASNMKNNNDWSATSPNTQADIMSLINSTNAQDMSQTRARMDFPQVLSHLQSADGKSPLSPQQRDSVLQLMASGQGKSSTEGSNNALISPNPPNVPSLEKWNATERQLQDLERTLKEQGDNVAQLTNMLQPLSPSGSIPGLSDGQYIPPPEGLDLNQLFDTDQYFNDPSGDIGQDYGNGNGNANGFDFGGGGDYSGADEFSFDGNNGNNANLNWNNQNSSTSTGYGETLSNSEGTSPANTAEDAPGGDDGRNPRKRRRRN